MKFLVLGITGKRGSGKDTMANYLKAKYGFRVLTYTNDVLAPMLEARGKEVTRENLISLALRLRKEGGTDVLTRIMSSKISRLGLWAISGVRYPEEVEYFRECFGYDFVFAGIACPARKRYGRVVKRATKGEGRMSYGKFMEIERKETERVIDATMKLTDFSLHNSGTPAEFRGEIDALAKNLGIAKT